MAIIRGDPGISVCTLAEIIYKYGIRAMEITMNTPGAIDLISKLTGVWDKKMLIGAGTVTMKKEIKEVAAVGGRFVVSPHTDKELITTALEQGLFPIPGALTPSEIVQALKYGASMVKIFPASLVGPGYIAALKAPFGVIKTLPTGGINTSNAKEFLEKGATALGVGSSLFKVGPGESHKELENKLSGFIAEITVYQKKTMSLIDHKNNRSPQI